MRQNGKARLLAEAMIGLCFLARGSPLDAQTGAGHEAKPVATATTPAATSDDCWAQIKSGQWLQARPACEREEQLDKDYSSTVNLGHTYLLQGQREEAYRWYRESVALIDEEKDLREGPLADFDLFISKSWQVQESLEARSWFLEAYANPTRDLALHRQAIAHRKTGNLQHAEAIAVEALRLREGRLSAEHPDTAVSLSLLAGLYQDTGRYEQALQLYQRALAIREKALGPEHPSTGASLNNLAGLYSATGRYEQALSLYQRALAISETALGPEHPSTGASLNNLAGLYSLMGRYEQALPLYQRALGISEKALGPEHPSTGTSLNNLAGLYSAMGSLRAGAAALLEVAGHQ